MAAARALPGAAASDCPVRQPTLSRLGHAPAPPRPRPAHPSPPPSMITLSAQPSQCEPTCSVSSARCHDDEHAATRPALNRRRPPSWHHPLAPAACCSAAAPAPLNAHRSTLSTHRARCAHRRRPHVDLGRRACRRGRHDEVRKEIKEPCAALPVCARALQTCLQVLGPGTMQRVLSWASSFPFTITSRCTRAQCPDRTILRLRARESFVAWSVRVRCPSPSSLCVHCYALLKDWVVVQRCVLTRQTPPLSYGSVR